MTTNKKFSTYRRDYVVTTREQRLALKRLFERSPDGASNYLAFRRRARLMFGDNVLMIKWCRMWIGIEPDGYTHS
jgi:hypothetical protein